MKGIQRQRTRRVQSFGGSDRRPVGKPLPLKCMLPQGIAVNKLRATIFAQFSEHDRPFGIQSRVRDTRVADHAGNDFDRLIQFFRGRVRQVEFIHGLCRGSLRVAVAAKCHAKTLPDPFCLAVWNKGRAPEGQMLDEMRKALLFVIFMQGTCIDTNTD